MFELRPKVEKELLESKRRKKKESRLRHSSASLTRAVAVHGVVSLNTSSEPVTIKKGDRIAQLLIQPVLRVDVQLVVGKSSETERQGGGFGSTESSLANSTGRVKYPRMSTPPIQTPATSFAITGLPPEVLAVGTRACSVY